MEKKELHIRKKPNFVLGVVLMVLAVLIFNTPDSVVDSLLVSKETFCKNEALATYCAAMIVAKTIACTAAMVFGYLGLKAVIDSFREG